eukprot:1177691-Rhodomonas_salina.1
MEWMAVRPITFNALRQAATIYYDKYVRMKGNEKLQSTQQDFVQFNSKSSLQTPGQDGCRAQYYRCAEGYDSDDDDYHHDQFLRTKTTKTTPGVTPVVFSHFTRPGTIVPVECRADRRGRGRGH